MESVHHPNDETRILHIGHRNIEETPASTYFKRFFLLCVCVDVKNLSFSLSRKIKVTYERQPTFLY